MDESKTVLVTGGAGYLGCHMLVELADAGYTLVVIDNLANSSVDSIQRVRELFDKRIHAYDVDLLDKDALSDIFLQHKVSVVLHLAALKKVRESCEKPLLYYKVNVAGTINLLDVMKDHGVKRLVFSSSVTVYGRPKRLPLDEGHPTGDCPSPYASSKVMAERVLQDLASSDPEWSLVILRTFNLVGFHPSGCLDSDPDTTPDNLAPFVAQVASGRQPEVRVFGGDFDTPDGTAVRDFVHVTDVTRGMAAAVEKALTSQGCHTYNLGSGHGHSVLEVISMFEKVSGRKVPYKIMEQKLGDVGSSYADVSKAERELGWKPKAGLQDMCEDLWRWQLQCAEKEERTLHAVHLLHMCDGVDGDEEDENEDDDVDHESQNHQSPQFTITT